MHNVLQPDVRPKNPNFSSGPCSKRPGWNLNHLSEALVGRSHRAKPSLDRIREVSNLSRSILGVPEDYFIGIMPASDTGAMELAMWSMLGKIDIDILSWESFGEGWVNDVVKQLKLSGVRTLRAAYGEIPDLNSVDFTHDVIFTWNGTTSGVCVPDSSWIPESRKGLTFCDATSAVFAMDLDWSKLDVVTYSWQKVLGGEAQHGMLILSPKAIERLESYKPPWPLPKIFRITKDGLLNKSIFSGSTINTVSMLCIEDILDSLKWVRNIGGKEELFKRTRNNLKAVSYWVKKTPWVDFLAKDPLTRSSTSICLSIVDHWFKEMDKINQKRFSETIVQTLDNEGVAYDIGSYRDAPPGLRIWGGATIETDDIEALCPWLDWAYMCSKNEFIGSQNG